MNAFFMVLGLFFAGFGVASIIFLGYGGTNLITNIGGLLVGASLCFVGFKVFRGGYYG